MNINCCFYFCKKVSNSSYLCSRAADQEKLVWLFPLWVAECPPGCPAVGQWSSTEPLYVPLALCPSEEAHLLGESSGCPFGWKQHDKNLSTQNHIPVWWVLLQTIQFWFAVMFISSNQVEKKLLCLCYDKGMMESSVNVTKVQKCQT